MLHDDVQTHNCSKPTTMDIIINYHSIPVFPNFFARGPLLASKNNPGSSDSFRANTEYSDHKYPKLKICISELILDSIAYVPVSYVLLHYMF